MSTRAKDVHKAAAETPASAPQPDAAPAPQPPPAAATRKVNLVSKLSTKTVYGAVKRPDSADKPKALYNLYGVAHAIKKGTTDKGEYTAFLGNFEAVNLETGEMFAGGKCFVPRVVEEMLIGALNGAQNADFAASVQFALQVGIRPEPSNAYGYVYTCVPLVALAPGDVLENLRKAAADTPALTHQTSAQ